MGVIDAVLLDLALTAWAALAILPVRSPPPGARLAAASPVLALSGALAVVALLGRHIDEALAAHLPGPALEILALGLVAAGLARPFAPPALPRLARQLESAYALAALFAACRTCELLRIAAADAARAGGAADAAGQAVTPPILPVFYSLIACRLVLALGAGELLVPARPIFAPLAAVALAAYLALLPAGDRSLLLAHGRILTAICAALLLLAARWLKPALGRCAVAAGSFLAALVLTAQR